MSRVGNSSDPRVQRTRQLLLEAFMALVQEKRTIHSISIQEIAKRATVNRATFYAHFEDKYALVADWSREKFQRALVHQLPASSTLQRETLHRLILAVFDFMALSRRYSRPSNRQFELLYEMVSQQELYDLLLRWLQQVPSEIPRPVERRPSKPRRRPSVGRSSVPQRNGAVETKASRKRSWPITCWPSSLLACLLSSQ